jgi:allantoinase
MLDLAIKGATLLTEEGARPADIGIEGDRIAAVEAPGALPPARREIAADGLLVMAGVIDIHFHVRAPGHPERGTFASETRAAAAGGVTTILEMPISVPCCATTSVFRMRRELGESETHVNFGLYGAPGLLDRDQVLGMADEGAVAFKVFTHAIPPGREEEFEGLCLEGEDQLYRMMELVKESGLIVSCHAENERLIQLFNARTRGMGRKDAAAFVESRPPVVEAMSVAQLVVLCGEVGARVHIAHVSCEAALRELQRGQALGLPMTGESCPHYLGYEAADVLRLGPYALIKPPLRSKADQEALWQGLFDGSLLAITTDHSPFTAAEKARGVDDIWQAAIGTVGIEALVPFVFTEALDGRMDLTWVPRLLTAQPARLMNLWPERGVVQPGAAADLTLYDPRGEGVIDSSRWFTKARETDRLYHGRRVRGRVAMTVVGGTVVFDGEEIVAGEGTGRFIRPMPRA